MKAQPAHFALLAALLAGFAAHAATVHVTFDDSLTNTIDEARWEYRDVARTKDGEYYFNTAGATIESIEYAFAITSVVLCAKKASDKTTRNLMYRALSGKADQSTHELVVGIVPKEQVAFTSRWEWAQSDRVRSFALTTTNGTGNVYLYSADISGCYICPQPQNVAPGNVQGTRFTLSWENGGKGAVSNRVDMLEVRSVPEQGELADRYDFEDAVFYKNSTQMLSGNDYARYQCFTNSVKLYAPGGTNGVLQISTQDTPGALVYDGPGTVGNITLLLRAAKHSGDPTQSSRKVSLLWTADGSETNSFPDVEITNVFKTVRIPLTNMTDSARLVMKPASSSGDRRIWIDEMTFVRDYAEAYVATNALPPMATDQNRLRIRRLAPKTLYIATVTAFDKEGNPSEPSVPVEVETRSCDPDTVLFLR